MFETRKNKILLLSSVFALLLIFGNHFINSLKEEKKEYYLKAQSNLLKAKYQTAYRYLKIMSQDIYQMYSSNEKLIKILSKATKEDDAGEAELRKKAYKLLQRNYKRLVNMGVAQVHFHTADNRSFLRMYKPEDYGDDLSLYKKSVVLTNKTLKAHEGFEACRFMIGLRFVYPLFDANSQHIGSVGISFSSQHLLVSVTDNFLYDTHILLSKEMFPQDYDYAYKYKKTWESDDYLIDISAHNSKDKQDIYKSIASKELKEKIAKGIKTQEPFSVASVYNYEHVILTFLPIPSPTGVKNIAYIVSYVESDYLNTIEIEKSYLKTLFFTVLALVYAFSLYVLYNREKLKELALYDALTKLPNRTLFMIELQDELNRAIRYNTKVALLFIDLDGFKAVNDTYGHQTGDALLIKVAEILKRCTRKTDTVSRLSGDEFTVIVPDIKDSDDALKIANNIIKELNKDIIIDHNLIHIGASIGIAIYPTDTKEPEELIKYADNTMYESKESGKNRVTLYKKEEEKN